MLPSSGRIPARSSVLEPKMAVLDRIKSSSPMAVGCGAIGVTSNRCALRRRGRRRETAGRRLTRPATTRWIRHNLVLQHDQSDRPERRRHHLTARDRARAARRFPLDLMISYCPVRNRLNVCVYCLQVFLNQFPSYVYLCVSMAVDRCSFVYFMCILDGVLWM